MTTLNIENDHGDDVKTMVTIKLLHHLGLGDNLDNDDDNLDNDDDNLDNDEDNLDNDGDDMILRMMSTIINLSSRTVLVIHQKLKKELPMVVQ